METKVEALIREVKRHPCLYVKSMLGYSNKNKRADAWVRISKAVNMTENVCMGKWRSLRDRFVRESHRNPLAGDSKWGYFDQMSFLREYVETRKNKWKAPVRMPKIAKYSVDSRDGDECTTDAAYLYENTMDDDCVDYNVIKGEEEEVAQPEMEFHNGCKSVPSIANTLADDCVSEQEADECGPQRKKYKSMEETYISFMERMTYIQEKWLESKSGKHYGFLQMLGEKLDQLPYSEQEDAKMLFLNYLHSKIRKQKILKNNKNL